MTKHANALEMGADAVVDTSDGATAVAKIREATNGGPLAAIDLVGPPRPRRWPGRRC